MTKESASVTIKEQVASRPRPATIKTLAFDLGLSIATVSRALQGDPLVTAATRARVNEAADRLGYRRDFRGVNLRTGKTFTLCALLASNPSPEFGDPSTMHLIQGLIDGTQGSDFKVVIRPVEGADAQLATCREAVIDGRFDGFVLDHTEPNDPRVAYLLDQNIPFITFGRTDMGREHAYFDIDNEDAAYVATRHLLMSGHTRIALIDPPQHYLFTRQRLNGYQRALAEAGVPYDPALVTEMGIGIRRVRDHVSEILAMADRPTGFVSSNEVATIGTLRACRDLPAEEFARCGVVSRDGTNLFDYLEPPVSSVYFSLLEAGQHLTSALIELVQGKPIAQMQRVENARLIVRS